MILTIVEPGYFPASTHFGKFFHADVIIWADTFRFRKGSKANKTEIKTVTGAKRLTIPILSKKRGQQTITEAEIDSQQNWAKHHLRAICSNYKNAPYFFFYYDELEKLYRQKSNKLSDFLKLANDSACTWLQLKNTIIPASQFDQHRDRTERLLRWLFQTGCDSYLLYPHEVALLDHDRLSQENVKLFSAESQPIPYHQQFGDFIPGLSVLDLLFNEGDQAIFILNTIANFINIV